MKAALALGKVKPLVIDYDDPEYSPATGERIGAIDYEDFLAEGDPDFRWPMPGDEWDAISLNYTSGHDRQPEGRRLSPSRRLSARASATSSPAAWRGIPSICGRCRCSTATAGAFPGRSRSSAGTHVCLRQVRASGHVRRHRRPQGDASVRRADRHVDAAQRAGRRKAAARPHGRVLHRAPLRRPRRCSPRWREAGFNVTHLYGLTETYGPAAVNEWHAAWDGLAGAERARCKARQGVRYVALDGLDRHGSGDHAARFRQTARRLGEVMFRGNIVMKGYLKNAVATEEAFRGGWFHSGDLGVLHPDGYIQLKDRSKDIIISGGENISSIEVEDALYKHPAVAAAAVVAKPDEKWGETPCAFIELEAGEAATAEELIAWCRTTSPATRCRATWSSPTCQKPRPARSRNTSFARWRRRSEAARPAKFPSAAARGLQAVGCHSGR